MTFKSIGSLATDVLKKVEKKRAVAAICPATIDDRAAGAAAEKEAGALKAPASSDREENSVRTPGDGAADANRKHMPPALRLVMVGRGMESGNRRKPGVPARSLSRPMLIVIGGLDHAARASS
ncbi:MAG: hypothetical protein JWM16_6317 [Verrucomicrobiales bacterium]|nr:hypothetical protein [Verrucomicrobiales bacterium]